MSIVNCHLPNVSAQTRAFISGRLKGIWHGDIYANRGGGRWMAGKEEVGGNLKVCVGIQVAVWTCLQTTAKFKVKLLDWVK